MKYKLLDIASARSGDKNNICNIGVMAKDTASYKIIKELLTADYYRSILSYSKPQDYR